MKVTARPGKALACLGLAAVLIAGVAWVILASQRQVRVVNSDPRFHVLKAKIVRSPNDCLFFGNQLEARARLYLRARTGLKIPLLPVVPPPNPSPFLIPDTVQPCTLAIRYRWDNAQSKSRYLSAELVDRLGQVCHARFSIGFVGRNNSQYAMWDLNGARTSGGIYRVKIKDHESCLAELELKNLPPVPPFHLGPNAF
jgi:hypothetical protein